LNLPGVNRFTDFVVRLIVVWVMLAAVAALIWPAAFTWFQPLIVPGLGLIMFGMGITLTPADFKRVARQPSAVSVTCEGAFGKLSIQSPQLLKTAPRS
jgi:BASS family bile acid:Na+ symporter